MKLFDIIWKNRSPRQRNFISFFLGVTLFACFVGGYALYNNTHTSSSQTEDLNLKKGHTSAVTLNIQGFGDELVAPGEERTLRCSLRNDSTTDNAFVFVEVGSTPNVWNITPGSGWTEIDTNVYAYGNGNMTPVGINSTVDFTATMTVAATGATYQGLNNDSFKVSVTAMAINESASREAISDSFADYESGGNADKIEALEQV
jgi:hypothetical protein